jgi:hypothetical protein
MAPYGIPRRSFSAKEEEPLPVNWRRGLFRVWLLFSAAWMMGRNRGSIRNNEWSYSEPEQLLNSKEAAN